MLHDFYAAELDWINHDKTAFESEEVCEFVANVALYPHAEYVERDIHCMNINVQNLQKDEIKNKVKERKKEEERKERWNKFTSLFKKK